MPCRRGADAVAVSRRLPRRAAAKGQPWALARAARAEGCSRPTTRSRAGSSRRCAGTTRRPTRSSARAASWPTASGCAACAGAATRASTCARRSPASSDLGAEPWAERARLELAATGETTRKRDPSTLDQLTPRELQSRSTWPSGLTTREAAAKLYLSPKTIEYHLRSVYRKLGIRSRAELTEAFAEPPSAG